MTAVAGLEGLIGYVMSKSMTSPWQPLQDHYERCLHEGGVTPMGVDWPNGPDLEVRFATQLGVLDAVPSLASRPVLLDLGCGPGLLLDYMKAAGRSGDIAYRGIDISPDMIAAARKRWPNEDFTVRDLTADPLPPQSVDVIVMNGVLTERQRIPRDEMLELAKSIIAAAFSAARFGIAFNVMSRNVDWERDDLFHWGFDDLAHFIRRTISPHYSFRADYGLYEFTTFIWRQPQRLPPCASAAWWER